MAVREYQKGKFRAYKQINGAVSFIRQMNNRRKMSN